VKFQVQVPASTANLGPAFDCAAIALNLHLRVSVETRPRGFEVSYRGIHKDRIPVDDDNLVVKAIKLASSSTGDKSTGTRLLVENDIPIGVGLGSSAAAIIAGLLIGKHLSGSASNPNQILREALQLENHPDNISAALHGGMVVAATFQSPHSQDDQPNNPGREIRVLRTEVSPDLHFIAVTPDVPLPTEKARYVLPQQYSRTDLLVSLQNSALLSAAFFSGQRLLPEFFSDRLHQPYRAPLVPGIEACLKFRHPDLGGVFLSGAGSSVMAIAYGSQREIGQALVEIFRKHGTIATSSVLQPDNSGAHLHSLDS
jgi:homoserine kinase